MSKVKKTVSLCLAVLIVICAAPLSGFATLYNPYGGTDSSTGSAYTEGTEYTYSTETTVTNSTLDTIWTDSTDSTETFRLAGATTGNFFYGNVVCKATKTGIPYVDNENSSYVYGDAANVSGVDVDNVATMPKLVLKIYGLSDISQFGNVYDPECDELSGASWTTSVASALADDSDGRGNYLKITFTLNETSTTTCGAGPDTDLVFSIDYTVKIPGTSSYKTFTDFAYAHTEYILHPNGVVYYGENTWDAGWPYSDYGGPAPGCSIVTILSENMKPSYAANSGQKQRGFYDGSQSSYEESGTYGLGTDGFIASGATQYDAARVKQTAAESTIATDNNGSLLYYQETDDKGAGYSASKRSYNDLSTFSTTGTDSNRVVSTVWLDRADEHLGKGTSSDGKTHGLNMRVIMQQGQYSDHYGSGYYGFSLYSNSTGHTSTLSTNTGTNIGSGQWTCDLSGKTAVEKSTWKISNDATSANNGNYGAGAGKGLGGYLQDYDVKQNRGWVGVFMSGTGPSASQTSASDSWCYGWTVIANGQNRNPSDVESGVRCTYGANASVRFRVYDSSVLRNLVTAIDSGFTQSYGTSQISKGVAFSYGGSYNSSVSATSFTITQNVGVGPQEADYTEDSWEAFDEAYDNARKLLCSFDVGVGTNDSDYGYTNYTYNYQSLVTLPQGLEQTKIDKAVQALVNAYNGLQKQEFGLIEVRHVLKSNTSVEVAPSEIFYGFDSNGNLLKTDSKSNLTYNSSSETITCTDGNTATTLIQQGAAFNVKALSYLKGYKATRNSITGTAKFEYNSSDVFGTATLTETGALELGSYVQMTYEPDDQTLLVHPYNGESSIVTYSVATGSSPDFTKISTDVGSKAKFNFGGYYEDSSYTGSAINTSTWKMPNEDDHLYVKWDAKNVKLHFNAVDNEGNAVALTNEYGTEVTPAVGANFAIDDVEIAKPAAAPSASTAGYTFIEYYSDEECTNVVEWPITASYDYGANDYAGSADYLITEPVGGTYSVVEIYAKYVNLNNKIFIEPNGGTIDGGSDTVAFTANSAVILPEVTRDGYTFQGWVDASGNAIAAGNPANVSAYDSSTYSITMSTTVGFTVYAKWTPNPITVTYRLGIPGSETSSFNSADSATSPFYTYTASADQVVQASELPPNTPRRYGYALAYWKANEMKFDVGSKYDTTDMTVTAVWKKVDTVAFADLTTYIKNAGTESVVDNQHTKTTTAAAGDTVTVKMIVSGLFYSGSQSYIFGYNSDFYEEITGVEFATVNNENTFINKIKPEVTKITSFSTGTTTVLSGDKDPADTSANVTHVGIAIDPDLSKMGGVYNTVSMDDQTYMLEIKLRIKDTVTDGTSGSVWLATDTLRSSDNKTGDMFISYTSTASSLATVSTDVITFASDDIVSTVTIGDETREETTITLTLPEGQGEFADGTTAAKTYVGREGEEILSTYLGSDGKHYQASGTGRTLESYVGFPTPTRTGYTIKQWTNTTSSTDTWNEGYYATSEQSGNTYQVEWVANAHTLTFYNDQELQNVRGTVNVVYDQIGVTPTSYPSGKTTEFIGWIPAGEEKTAENVVDFTTYHVTGDASFYALTKAAQKDVTINAYRVEVIDSETGETQNVTLDDPFMLNAATQAILGLELRVGDKLKIVETMPTTPDSNTQYLLASDLDKIFAGTYTYTDDSGEHTIASPLDEPYYELITSDLPITLTISSENTDNVINVKTQGVYVRDTYCASGDGTVHGTYDGAYADVKYTNEYGDVCWYVEGRYGEEYDFDTLTAGSAAPFGYSIEWDEAGTKVTYSGGEYTATIESVTVSVTFINNNFTTEVSGYKAALKTRYYATGSYANNDLNTTTNGVAKKLSSKTGYKWSSWVPAKWDESVSRYVPCQATAYDSTRGVYTMAAGYTEYSKAFNIKDVNDDYFTVTDGAYSLVLVPIMAPVSTCKVVYNKVYTNASGVSTTETINTVSAQTYDADITLASAPAAIAGNTLDSTGWYTTAECTDTPVAFGSTARIKATTTNYYAKYTANTYKITYDSKGGSNVAEQSFTYGATITAPTAPTKTGYTFAGWTYKNGTTAYTGTTMPEYDLTAEANWDVSEFHIYYDTDGGTEVADATVNYGVTIPSATTSKTGYTLNATTPFKYYEDASHTTEYTGTTMPNYDLYAFAQFTVNTHELRFVLDNGSADVVDTVAYGTELASYVPTGITKTGYESAGWDITVPATMPDYDVTITAKWNVKQYTITFDTDGGSEVSSITQDYGTEITKPADPTKTGYTFKGWYTDEACTTGNEYTLPKNMPDLGANGTEITVYAKWDVNQYTITFNTDGGSDIAPITANYGDDITAPANPTKTGYTFEDWSPEIPDTMPANDMTITAIYHINQYTIKFETGEGSKVDSITQNYDTAITPVANPTKTGYTFAGWYTDEACTTGNEYTLPENMPAYPDGFTVYAKWDINEYTITFDTDSDDSEINPITQDYNRVVTAPEDPTKTGYTFAGWYNGDSLYDFDVNTTMPAEDITLTAHWTINQYTITFNTLGGTEIEPITQDYGTTVTAPENPTKDGYTFGSWDREIPNAMPAENITITANWNINHNTLKYNLDGATAITEKTADTSVTFNEVIQLPELGTDFVKTGYAFDGWYDNSAKEGIALGSTYTIPAKENGTAITLYAKWSKEQYTITFDGNGGSDVTNITGSYGDPLPAPEDPTKAGYDFDGWTLNGEDFDFNEHPTFPDFGDEGEYTFIAKWTEHTYTVEFVEPDAASGAPTYDNKTVYNDGTNWTLQVETNAALSGYPSGNPDVQHYTFIGWSTTEPQYDADGELVVSSATIVNDLSAWRMPAEEFTTIYFYPAYERVDVTLTIETNSGAEIVDADTESAPVKGYIYNVGNKKKTAAVQEQLVVIGDGILTIEPSKARCGTGTVVTLKDNITNEVVEIYYLIVFGDVDGDATCNALDIGIIKEQIAVSDKENRTWNLAETVKMIEDNAELSQLRLCYERAADADGDNDADTNDAFVIEQYYFNLVECAYSSDEKRYLQVG